MIREALRRFLDVARVSVEDALEMALWTRQQADDLVAGLVHHSDAGSQYCAIRYTERLADAKAVASIGTVGDSYDNAQNRGDSVSVVEDVEYCA